MQDPAGPEGQRDREQDRFSFPGNSPLREAAIGTFRLLGRQTQLCTLGPVQGAPLMFITAAHSPHLYLHLARGPHSPGLILAMVGPEVVYEMPKETAATCEQQRERGGKGDTRQEFQAGWNF